MTEKLFICAAAILLIFYACKTKETYALVGTWRAASLKEKNVPVKTEWLPEVWFKFNENDTYEYHSTLNYKEAGRYRVLANGLYTKDTLIAGAREKLVKIIRLNQDSLHLEMRKEGVPQHLMLIKD